MCSEFLKKHFVSDPIFQYNFASPAKPNQLKESVLSLFLLGWKWNFFYALNGALVLSNVQFPQLFKAQKSGTQSNTLSICKGAELQSYNNSTVAPNEFPTTQNCSLP